MDVKHFRFEPLTIENSLLFEHMTYPSFRFFKDSLYENNGDYLAIGAYYNNIPAGLTVSRSVDNSCFELCSIFVEKEYRNRGIAKLTLKKLTEELAAVNADKLTVCYENNRKHTGIVENILNNAGFSKPEVRSYIGRCFTDKLRTAPWLNKNLLLPGMEFFLWKDISADELSKIKSCENGFDYPDFLSPFSEPEIFEPSNSLGLRYNGKIAGWQINHRINPQTIRYSRMFVRTDLQPFGLALPLLFESIKMHVATHKETGISQATFVINKNHAPQMFNFAQKHMHGYIDTLNQFVESFLIIKNIRSTL